MAGLDAFKENQEVKEIDMSKKIQVGIIGAIGDCYSSIASDKVQDIYFKTGNDLTALGFRGKEIGAALHDLLEQVLDDALPNDKQALLRAREKRGN